MKRLLLSFLFLSFAFGSFAQFDKLMPVPQKVKIGTGKFRLTSDLKVSNSGPVDSRVEGYLRRILFRLDGRTGVMFSKDVNNRDGNGSFKINFDRIAELKVGEDESYTLQITDAGIDLFAATDLGVLHGMETLLQILAVDETGYYFPAGRIEDSPRFPWRGLLIDVCRHWQPVDVIKRNIDGMASVKMNVLHLHLTEDQGFRIESKKFPDLHLKGSNGDFFTQEQMKDLIQYANDRGIRVMPEFDMPGHATSWFVGHPELASEDRDYEIEKGYGVFDPTFDVTKESTYEFLDVFLSEMCTLFQDEYFHIGGDENNGKQWEANKSIRKFMKEKGYQGNHELQTYFNTRMLKILSRNNKKMVGWDEILTPELPNNTIIQSWRGSKGVERAASGGYQVMLSNGYYIDLCQSTEYHYLNDPLPNETTLTPEQQKLVLGGEATMWAELVTPETIDSRIWPRTAAIAERLWSPKNVKSIADMYRRLEFTSLRLEEVGLQHLKNRGMMMRRLCNGYWTEPLEVLLKVVQPLQVYKRHHQGVAYSTELPFTRIPDAAWPDPYLPREFDKLVKYYLAKPEKEPETLVRNQLNVWKKNYTELQPIASQSPILKPILPMSKLLSELSDMALQVMDAQAAGNPLFGPEWMTGFNTKLEEAKEPYMESELQVVDSIDELVRGVYRTGRR